MKRLKSFNNFTNEDYKVNNITEDDIILCIKNGGAIYSDIVSNYPNNKDWNEEPLTAVDIENGEITVDIDGTPHYVKLENVKRIEWNNISELFDSEELKNSDEIDYLSGKIDKKKMSSTIQKYDPLENLRNRLVWDTPFLTFMKVFRSGKDLIYKLDKGIKYSDSDSVNFMLEIFITVNKPNDYTMTYKMETIGNGQSLFKRLESFGIMNYTKLIKTIKENILRDTIEWNEHSFKMFKETPFPNAPEYTLNLNTRYN